MPKSKIEWRAHYGPERGQDQRSAVAMFLTCMSVRVCRPKLFKKSLSKSCPPLLFRTTPLACVAGIRGCWRRPRTWTSSPRSSLKSTTSFVDSSSRFASSSSSSTRKAATPTHRDTVTLKANSHRHTRQDCRACLSTAAAATQARQAVAPSRPTAHTQRRCTPRQARRQEMKWGVFL